MINVVILCVAGMSSSLLLDKINRQIKEDKEAIYVISMPYIEMNKYKGEFDVLLVTPQMNHLFQNFKDEYESESVAVDSISLQDLGMLKADLVIQQIKDNYERMNKL